MGNVVLHVVMLLLVFTWNHKTQNLAAAGEFGGKKKKKNVPTQLAELDGREAGKVLLTFAGGKHTVDVEWGCIS